MPTKKTVPLEEYIENISHYRKEFIKRSDKYKVEASKLKLLFDKYGVNIDDISIELYLLPNFFRNVPDFNGKIIDQEDGRLSAVSYNHKNISFTFEVNPYLTIEGFRHAFEKFKNDTVKIFREHIKSGYTKFQADYKYNKKNRIEYFNLPTTCEPFDLWKRQLAAYDLSLNKISNAQIGERLNSFYGNLEKRSLLRAVKNDLLEAQRLITCAKYDSFPNDPLPRKNASPLIPPPQLGPPKHVYEAFQKVLSKPETQEAIAQLRARNKAKRLHDSGKS